MSQRWVPAVFMRGGTSKGLFFHAGDLPADPGERDRLLLAALGSPDPFGRQLDGMGGGISSLSKAAVIGPPTRPGADVDYTFAQVAVDRPVVDLGANCGNLSSAVGPFAVDQGLCPRPDGPALVRIHNTNTGRLLQASFTVPSTMAGPHAIESTYAPKIEFTLAQDKTFMQAVRSHYRYIRSMGMQPSSAPQSMSQLQPNAGV